LQGTAPAPVVLVHGFGEHIGRYANLGRALAASGRTLWAMDLAGFGRSDGPRAMAGPLSEVISDIGLLVAAAGGPAGPGAGPKPVLLGHSMGGAFAAAYALEHADALSALVLSAPAVHLAARPKWQVMPAEGLAAVAPRAGLGRIVPAKLSRDPEVVAQFAADPLVWHGSVPARSAVEMYRAGKLVMKRADELRLPLLVLHGEADAIVPVASSRRLFDAAGSRDKQIRTFKGLYHEVFQEVGKQEVIAVLLEWLGRHKQR
jgi:alpha-beta hydrolase superfamily lysophospholipase